MTTLALLLALVGDPAAAPTPAPVSADKPAVDLTADTPPPSSYDRFQQQDSGEASGPARVEEEGRSIASQLVRTVLSLLFVVALIYAVGRIGLTRLGRFKGVTGQRMKLTERLQLDARNALFLVEVDGKQWLLGGGGEKGVTLLARVSEPSHDSEPKAAFAATLERVEKKEQETPRDEVPR